MNEMKYPEGVMNCLVTDQAKYVNDGIEKLILSFRPSHVWHVPEGMEVNQGQWVEVPIPSGEDKDPAIWLSAGASAKAAKFQARQRMNLGYNCSYAQCSENWLGRAKVGESILVLNKANEYKGVTKDNFSVVTGLEPPVQKVNPQKASQQAILADAAMQELLAEEQASPAPAVQPQPPASQPQASPAAVPVAAGAGYPAPPASDEIPF